jgi:hypothetical protein
MTGAIRDFILFRADRNLKMVLITLAITTFFYTLFMSTGIIRATPMPAGWFSVVGGILFGIGMAIAGGCVVSTYYRIGEGSINYLITGIMIPVGIAIAAATFHKWWTLPMGKETPFLGSKYGLVWLGSFEKMHALGNAITDIPIIVFGIIQALIFALLYYKLEKGG